MKAWMSSLTALVAPTFGVLAKLFVRAARSSRTVLLPPYARDDRLRVNQVAIAFVRSRSSACTLHSAGSCQAGGVWSLTASSGLSVEDHNCFGRIWTFCLISYENKRSGR